MTPTRQVLSVASRSDLPVSEQPHFLVGRDHGGQWVVRDAGGRGGGLFKTRDEALRFARHELRDGTDAIILVPGTPRSL